MTKGENAKNEFENYTTDLYNKEEQISRSKSFFELMNKRRTIRHFSEEAIPQKVIENIVKTASTAPSGAHKQPWTFCIVQDLQMKQKIRIAAEKEEYENYHGRMSEDWLKDLAKFDTDWNKPFLENAPALIVVFKKTYDMNENGEKQKNYYVNESVGIATGMLIAAIHQAGLCSLTHTPSPMNFLQKVLKRPENEKAFLLIPIGYASSNCKVPVLNRKPLEEVMVKF